MDKGISRLNQNLATLKDKCRKMLCLPLLLIYEAVSGSNIRILRDKSRKLDISFPSSCSVQFSLVPPLVPWAALRWVSCWWFWSCRALCSVLPSAGGGECAAMTTCGGGASHPPPECLWSHTSTWKIGNTQAYNFTICNIKHHICKGGKMPHMAFKNSKKVFSDHMWAFLWTWTMGLYFLYGRFRDIISTEPSSSKMLMYWKERKSAITHWHRALTEVQSSLSLSNVLSICPFKFWIHFLWPCLSITFLCLSLSHKNTLLYTTHTPTWGLLSSMATSLRLTIRSTLGEEKSTSDLGFIRSLASAEIGQKTVDQQKGIDYFKQIINLGIMMFLSTLGLYLAFLYGEKWCVFLWDMKIVFVCFSLARLALQTSVSLCLQLKLKTKSVEMCWWW